MQTFISVEEMVLFYETEPLILYSGGELAGRTRLKAPPPGLVRGSSSSNPGSFHSTEHTTSSLTSSSSTERHPTLPGCPAKSRANTSFNVATSVNRVSTNTVSRAVVKSNTENDRELSYTKSAYGQSENHCDSHVESSINKDIYGVFP